MLAGAPHDFDFLVGSWNVRHRKLKTRPAGSNDWEDFTGTLVNWPVMGGHGNIGDNVMDAPAGTFRGMGIRTWDADAKLWRSWWLDRRNPATIGPAVEGRFADGLGIFEGADSLDGRPIRIRVHWSRITPTSARWEQSASADNGATWEVNWISDFQRRA